MADINGIAVAGGPDDDTIGGTGKNDLLLGGGGSDTLYGRNGSDELIGGKDDDEIYGGNGSDTLRGDRGLNTLYGGNGDDVFVINAAIAGQGFDVIADFDVGRQLRRMTFDDAIEIKNVDGQEIVFTETVDGDVVLTIDGFDVALFNGSENSELSAADLLAVTVFEGGVPSSVSLVDEAGDPINFKIDGTGDDDVLEGKPGISNTIVGNDGDDVVVGADKDDLLLGNMGDDELIGSDGNDTLLGGADDDNLDGGAGNDWLNGDKGDDTVTGGDGDDKLRGGSDSDVFVFDTDDGTDTVADFEDGVDMIKLDGVAPAAFVFDGTDTVMTFGATTVTFLGVDVDSDDVL